MMPMSISENLRHIRDQIAATGRPIQLIAVSKMQSLDAIREAAAAGQHHFGENYVQELIEKAETLSDLKLNWHFIGHMQRNKINTLLPHVSTIQSIDSIRLAEAIATRATRPIAGFVEVNVGGETSKSGITADALPELLRACSDFENLAIKGLMCIPPPTDDRDMQKKYFTQIADLQTRANTEGWYKTPLTELSMGMSHDFMVAIDCGATCVRVGTAIFGERS
jgi:pyridoxal phosphate enzyme (YggS family)